MPSFTHALRVRGEAGLVSLLAARPDLAAPPPSSVRSLAARAANRVSLDRALAAVDAAVLQVLEAVLALDGAARPGDDAPRTGVPLGDVLAALGADHGAGARPTVDVRPAVRTALDAALLWTDPPSGDDAWPALADDVVLRPAPGLADVLGPHPAGLGPTLHASLERRSAAALERLATAVGVEEPPAVGAVVARLSRPDVVRDLLAQAPPGVLPVLTALAWGPPVGRSPEAGPGTPSPARAAVEWALRHGLLAVSDAQHVVLPREVGLALRAGRTHRHLEVPPQVEGPVVDDGTVAAESARHAEEAVRLAAGLVALWGEDPAAVLRAGGIGARELRRVAQRLEVGDGTAALVVEVAGAAGLVLEDGEESPAMAPAAAADDWLDLPPTEQWADLAVAWLRAERAAWLVGTRNDKGALRAALDPESRRPWAPRLRRTVLAVLADVPPGTAPTAGVVHDLLRWRTPRSVPPLHAVEAVLSEAASLGVLGAGALSPAGRALLADDDATGGDGPGGDRPGGRTGPGGLSAPAAALAGQLPPDVDEVLLQGDLTGIVPGRPSPGLSALLEGAAQVESRGAALTVRFTETSVRRALDTGRTAEDLLAELSRHARAGVPQPLEYLVLDTARRHGRTRVGMASSYVRSDDPALLAGLAEDPALRGLGLLRLAPTVLAAQATPAALLAALRDRGLAPVTEDGSGQVVLGTTAARRVRPARGRRGTPSSVTATEAAAARDRRLHRVARDLLSVDRREQADVVPDDVARGPAAPTADPVLGLDLLREAASAGTDVWLEMVDPSGVPLRRRVRPVRVDGGRVRVVDAERETEMTVAVHRIASVSRV
nr:helicase-associated domain-containing protein [uncultured Actinotalea sp.]